VRPPGPKTCRRASSCLNRTRRSGPVPPHTVEFRGPARRGLLGRARSGTARSTARPDFFVLESAARGALRRALGPRPRSARADPPEEDRRTRTFASTALLDWGFAEGGSGAARALAHLTARTRAPAATS
jgi:hypothetical protein